MTKALVAIARQSAMGIVAIPVGTTRRNKNKNETRDANWICERVINAWNGLPSTVDFRNLIAFKRTIRNVNFSVYLKRY